MRGPQRAFVLQNLNVNKFYVTCDIVLNKKHAVDRSTVDGSPQGAALSLPSVRTAARPPRVAAVEGQAAGQDLVKSCSGNPFLRQSFAPLQPARGVKQAPVLLPIDLEVAVGFTAADLAMTRNPARLRRCSSCLIVRRRLVTLESDASVRTIGGQFLQACVSQE